MKLDLIGNFRVTETDQVGDKFYLTITQIQTNDFKIASIQSLEIQVPEKIYRRAMGMIMQGVVRPEIGLYLEDE